MGTIERFASTDVAPAHRLNYWNKVCTDALCRTTVDSPVEGFRAEMWRWMLGDLKLIRPRSDASVVRRAGGDQDGLVLHLQLKGRSRLVSDGRVAELGAGDFILSEAGQGYSFELSQGHEFLVAEMPRQEMLRRVPDLEAQICRSLSGLTPGGRVFRDFLLTLWRQGEPQPGHLPQAACPGDRDYAESVLDAFCDLCALAVRGAEMRGAAETAPAAPVLRRRFHAYIDAHLGDPDLGTARLAEEFCVSPRTVQGVFSNAGCTPTSYIQERRLCRAADCLRSEPRRSITDIAFDLGFNDSAYFTRLFRRRYGMSPSDWRSAG